MQAVALTTIMCFVAVLTACYELDDHSVVLQVRFEFQYAPTIHCDLSGWAEEHGLRAAGQAGFRRDHRTTDNIFIMTHSLSHAKQ